MNTLKMFLPKLVNKNDMQLSKIIATLYNLINILKIKFY